MMNMSTDDYDLKKSKSIGELYPVLKDARGKIIDGNHRLEADPNWKTQIVPEIDTDEKLVIARMIANWQRRQVTPQEKAEWINALAEIYQKQGYKSLITSNEIVRKIVEVTGLSQPTVNAFLDDKYKVFTDKNRVRKPEISSHERIRNLLGEEFAERNEQEVVKKLLNSPKELLEKKLQNLPNEEERKGINNSQDFKPVLADIASAHICDTLKRFVALDSSILTDLNAEQKEKVLAVLLESQKKIDEMVKALK